MNLNHFEVFKQKADVVCGKINQLEELFNVLLQEDLNTELHGTLEDDLNRLKATKKRLSESSFKTLVIGEFKRGKSTFINALLQKKILPAYATPCTAVINEVKWGKDKKATIYFNEKLNDELPLGLSKKVLDHIETHGKINIPPLEVTDEEFQRCVVITDPGKEQAQGVFESPFTKAVIEYPLDICKSGIEIIDSPGLNEHKTRNEITEKYLCNVDAIIFVLLCDPLASASEMKSITDIYNMGHKSIFYVCNRFDNILEKEDQERVMNFARQKLLSFTDLGEAGLHFISSKNALDFYTKIPPDAKLLEKSRFSPMRKSLENFLVNDRGRIKLRQPCDTVVTLIEYQIENVINAVLEGLNANIEQLKAAHKELVNRVKNLRERATLEKENLQGKAEKVSSQITNEASTFVKCLAAKAPNWVHECDPQTSLGLFGGKATVEAIVQELSEYAMHCLEKEKKAWENDVMKPRLDGLISDFNGSCQKAIEAIGKELGSIKQDFDGGTTLNSNFFRHFDSVTGIESSALSGALVTTVSGILGGLGGALIGLICPWMLIPAILAAVCGSGIGKLLNNESRMNDIKDKVGEVLKQKILTEGLDKVTEGTEPMRERLNQQIVNMFNQVDSEIERVEGLANEKLKSCETAEDKRKEKQIFFEKIKDQKNLLLTDFKTMLDELSNPDYQISADSEEELFSKLAQMRSSSSLPDSIESPQTVLENVESAYRTVELQQNEERLNSFEKALLVPSSMEELSEPEISTNQQTSAKKKHSFLQWLIDLFKGNN